MSVSPDGSIIYGGQAGSLTTSEGTWTFGARGSDGMDWNTQLNGNANGQAVQMQITNGKLYAFNKVSGHWYVRQNATWVDVGTIAPVESAPPPPPPSVSPDGSIIYGGQAGSLTTSEGTWTFGARGSDGVDWNTQLNGNANGQAVQMQITNGKLYAFNKVSGHWYVRQNATWVDVGTTAPVESAPPPPPPSVSPDGSIIYGGQAGSLKTSEGTWAFGARGSDGVDWNTQLNGNANGQAVQMQITNGKLYAFNKVSGHWYVRQNATWVDVGTTAPVESAPPPPPPPPPPPSVSPDGSIIYGGQAGSLKTSEGTWTFGARGSDGVDWNTQLNGNANGQAVQMQITNGKLYAFNKVSGHWYVRQNATWVDVGTTAPVEGVLPTPTAITLSPASATIADNAPAGTLIATAKVTMSDGSQFAGTLTTSDTSFFAISGLNIVTARAFTSADDGTHSTVITASQGGQSSSIKFSV